MSAGRRDRPENKEQEEEFSGERGAVNAVSVQALRRGAALAFLVTLFLSKKLWLTTRDYPLAPIWSRIPRGITRSRGFIAKAPRIMTTSSWRRAITFFR